jgi:predicted nucleotidyltransferase
LADGTPSNLDPEALRHGFSPLRLLVLHGSRARGEAHASSDWDFAYVADPELDDLALRAALARALGSDRIDLVDLDRAGGLLRYRVARDGKAIFEREGSEFEHFSVGAVRFWLDAEPTIRSAYGAVLEGLNA